LALWIALRYSSILEPLLASISSNALKIWSARLIMFVLVLIAGGLLNALIGILVQKTGLTGTDRVLGMVFGAARGVLILGIAVMLFRLLDLDQETWWTESRVVPMAAPVADVLQTYFHAGLERLEEMVPPGGGVAETNDLTEAG
jgi:membrane protein required for colicin V production